MFHISVATLSLLINGSSFSICLYSHLSAEGDETTQPLFPLVGINVISAYSQALARCIKAYMSVGGANSLSVCRMDALL